MTLKDIAKELQDGIKQRQALAKIFKEIDAKEDAAFNAGYAQGMTYALFLVQNYTPDSLQKLKAGKKAQA